MDTKPFTHKSVDAALIERSGGATALAKKLNAAAKRLQKPATYTPQRVNNWATRGIPARERLLYPRILGRKVS